jgi:hypothetical protein
MSNNVGHRDPLYLFVCHLEWHKKRNLAAYQELLAALDDPNEEIRTVAEMLLHQSSPRPEPSIRGVEAW